MRLVALLTLVFIIQLDAEAACSRSGELDIDNDVEFERRMAASSVKIYAGWSPESKSASGTLVSANGYVLTVGHLFPPDAQLSGNRLRVLHKPLVGAPKAIEGLLVYKVYEPGVKGGLDFALVKIEDYQELGMIPAPLSFKVSRKNSVRLYGYRLSSTAPEISAVGRLESIFRGVFTVSKIERRQGFSGSLGFSDEAMGVGILGGQFKRPLLGSIDDEWSWSEEDDAHNETMAFQDLKAIVGHIINNAPQILGPEIEAVRKLIEKIYSQDIRFQTQELSKLYDANSLETLLLFDSVVWGDRKPHEALGPQLAVLLFCLVPEDDRIPLMKRIWAHHGSQSRVATAVLKRVIDFGRERLAEFESSAHPADLDIGTAALSAVIAQHEDGGAALASSLLRDAALELVAALRQSRGADGEISIAQTRGAALRYLVSNHGMSRRVWSEAALNFGESKNYDLAAEASAQALLLSRDFEREALAQQYLYYATLAGESDISSTKKANYEVRTVVPVSGVLGPAEIELPHNERDHLVVPVQVVGRFGAIDVMKLPSSKSISADLIKRIGGEASGNLVLRSVSIPAAGRANTNPSQKLQEALVNFR